MSFSDFLRDEPGGRTLARNRRVASGFVEGFHAADLERINAVSLGEAGSPGDDEREQRLGRLPDGYDRVIRQRSDRHRRCDRNGSWRDRQRSARGSNERWTRR